MLDFCQPVSYYPKLSVLWVRQLLSKKLIDTFCLNHPHPIPNGWGRRGDVGRDTKRTCWHSQGCNSIHFPCRLFKYESVQPIPTLLKGKNKWVGGWVF